MLMARILFIIFSVSPILVFAVNAEPFGQEIGVVKCSQFMLSLSDKVKFQRNGTNRYSNGPMYFGNANNLNFEGATSILLICDKNDILSMIQVILDSNNIDGGFDKYNNIFNSKYKQVKMTVSKNGDRYAKYSQGSSFIELISTKVSSDITLTYITNQLFEIFEHAKHSAVNAQTK